MLRIDYRYVGLTEQRPFQPPVSSAAVIHLKVLLDLQFSEQEVPDSLWPRPLQLLMVMSCCDKLHPLHPGQNGSERHTVILFKGFMGRAGFVQMLMYEKQK